MHRLFVLLCAAVFSFCQVQPILAQQGPFNPGDVMPDFEISAPDDRDQREYLGLTSDQATFTLADIDARAVLLQVFSMYCPICQKEAPQVNELFAAIASRNLEDQVKILGIGAGNSDLEVQVFRTKYDVPFPMISDPDYILHKLFAGVGTPYFVLVEPVGEDSSAKHVVRFSHLGSFDNPNDFLERLLAAME